MKKKNTAIIFCYAIAILAAIFTIFPLYWTLVTSFKTYKEAFSQPPQFFVPVTLKNYAAFIEQNSVLLYLKNSVIISTFSVVVPLILGLFASYAVTRSSLPGKEGYSLFLLASADIVHNHSKNDAAQRGEHHRPNGVPERCKNRAANRLVCKNFNIVFNPRKCCVCRLQKAVILKTQIKSVSQWNNRHQKNEQNRWGEEPEHQSVFTFSQIMVFFCHGSDLAFFYGSSGKYSGAALWLRN